MPLFYLIVMVEKTAGEITIRVNSPEDYRDAIRDADSFGMELEDSEVRGRWRRITDSTEHNITNRLVSLDHVAGGYFYINAGEIFPCEPIGQVGEGGYGYVKLTFR